MKIRFFIVILIVIAGAMGAVWHFGHRAPRTDANLCLKQAYESAQSASYDGTIITKVLYNKRQVQTRSHIYHDGSKERVEYASTGSTVITSGNESRTYNAKTRQIVVSRIGNSYVKSNMLDLIRRNYNMSAWASGNVAGRPVNLLEITPKESGSPSKKLWIDQKTGVVLKSQDICPMGRILSEMEFAEIHYPAQITKTTFAEPSLASAEWNKKEEGRELTKEQAEKVIGRPISTPRYIPNGYVMDGIRLHPCGCCCKQDSVHLRYTNGLNSISVFETPNMASCHDQCMIHCPKSGDCEVKDACQACVASVSVGNLNIIVVATLPKGEIEKITKSIR